MRPSFLIALFSTMVVHLAWAQEGNLWNQQYGTRSTLLGGAVIGSVTDMSATYYNPGALALFKEGSVLLSARGYEYSRLSLAGGGGEGKEITSSSITPVPDLVASSLPFDWFGAHTMAFSILVRNSGKTDLQARGPIKATSPGGTAGAELILQNDLSEFWAGLTWSTLISDRIGVGFTTYLAIRDQERRTQLLSEELKPTGDIAASIIINNQVYQHYRLLWKAGIGFNLHPLTIGATVTTPGVGLFGSGSSLVNNTSTGFDKDGDGINEDILAGSYQDGIDSDYRSSWAFGLGAGYDFGEVAVHVSSEYIADVGFFRVLDSQDFTAQSSGDTVSVHLTHETKEIVNVAAAAEVMFSDRTKGYVSFATDFSAAVRGGGSTLAVTHYDIYHVAAGAAFSVGRWDLIVGGVYALGSDKLRRVLDIDDPGGLGETLANSTVRFSRIRVLFGFSFALE